MDYYCGPEKYVYRVAENRNNIPIRIEVTQTTAPRLLRKCKSGHHEYFHRFSILFCKSALHVEALLRNAFYYCLPPHVRTYHVEVSIRPHARARYFCVSPPWYVHVLFSTQCTYQNRLSLKVSKQKVGE